MTAVFSSFPTSSSVGRLLRVKVLLSSSVTRCFLPFGWAPLAGTLLCPVRRAAPLPSPPVFCLPAPSLTLCARCWGEVVVPAQQQPLPALLSYPRCCCGQLCCFVVRPAHLTPCAVVLPTPCPPLVSCGRCVCLSPAQPSDPPWITKDVYRLLSPSAGLWTLCLHFSTFLLFSTFLFLLFLIFFFIHHRCCSLLSPETEEVTKKSFYNWLFEPLLFFQFLFCKHVRNICHMQRM